MAGGSDVSLWLLYAVIALLGLISAVDKPLRKAFVRDVVSAGELESATRLFSPLWSVGQTTGSALAALMLALSMPRVCFVLNSVAGIATELLVATMPRSVGVISAAQRKARGWMLGYLKCTPAVSVPLLLLICFSLLGWNVPVVAQLMVDTQMQAEPGGRAAGAFGMLISALSIGKLCGFVAVVWMGHSKTATACSLLAVFGLTLTPLAAVSGVVYSSRTVGAVFMGWLADTIGTRVTLAAAGVATILFTCAVLTWLSRRSSSL